MTIDVSRREAGVVDGVCEIDAIAARISAPPLDRDPLVWAAHEALQAARLLLEARAAGPQEERRRLADAAAQTRSATASLHYALRERA